MLWPMNSSAPRRASLVLAVAATASLTLAACGGGDEQASGKDGDLKVVNPGKLTVCADIPYPPFELSLIHI